MFQLYTLSIRTITALGHVLYNIAVYITITDILSFTHHYFMVANDHVYSHVMFYVHDCGDQYMSDYDVLFDYSEHHQL